jgi:hypothetical protein
MTDTFYVRDGYGNLVPAKYLSDAGQYVTDPNQGVATSIKIYDANGNLAADQNVNGYLVVPVNYSLDQARDFGLYVKSFIDNPDLQDSGTVAALGTMTGAFWTGSPQDLQRNYQGLDGTLVANGPAVPAFQDAASFHLGAVTAVSGLPVEASEVGGGLLNWGKSIFGSPVDTSGAWGNNPNNVISIEGGYNYMNGSSPQSSNWDGSFADQLHGVTYSFSTAPDGSATVTAENVSAAPDAFAQATLRFNTDGVIDQTTGTLGNGTTISTDIDVNDLSAWAQQTTIRNVEEQITHVDTLNDDGSRVVDAFDGEGNQIWSMAQAVNGSGSLSDNAGTAITFSSNDVFVLAGGADGLPVPAFVADYGGGRSIVLNADDTVSIEVDGNVVFTAPAGAAIDLQAGGTISVAELDSANAEPWAERETTLTALGMVETIITDDDDGTRINDAYDPTQIQTWSEQITNLDAQGHTLSIQTINDDNSQVTQVYDPNNVQTWTEQDTFLDALGRTDKIVTTNDDATKLIADLDQANTQLWSEQDTTLNAAGQTTQVVTLNDDASRETAVFDVANTQIWTEQDTFLDALGRTDKVVTTNDDATKLIADLDQAGTQLWSEQDTSLNAAGQTTQVVTHNDDGSRETDVFDVTNAQTWSVQETFLDAQGRTDKVDTVSDAGVQTIVDYDQDGSKPWTQETITIDALGRTDEIVALNDDGTTSTTTYDVAGTQTWSAETVTLDGLGRTLTTDVTEDSGTREVTAFDPANTQAWSEHLTEYDSTGRAVGDVYSYDTADTWTASHDLSTANLATFDEAAATDLAAEVERLAFEGTNAGDGMPTMFSYEPMFGSGYDFGMGDFDINSGNITTRRRANSRPIFGHRAARPPRSPISQQTMRSLAA